jgi:hypothetical protein
MHDLLETTLYQFDILLCSKLAIMGVAISHIHTVAHLYLYVQ